MPDAPRILGRDGAEISLHPCPGGPVLVRGDATVVGSDGTEEPTTRPVSAVCRCAASARLPWCDGTHKALARRAKGGR